MDFLKHLSNNESSRSLANRLRKKRFAFFRTLIDQVPRPIKLLDVGGTQTFWEHMNFADEADVNITLLNIVPVPTSRPHFQSICGNACDLGQFQDQEFDVVFSNSVIEHVGDYSDQQRMAKEIMRVGKRYFVQTPNYYFPLEPHFLFPCFQFLPFSWRTYLIQQRNLGWVGKANNQKDAQNIINSVQLLSKRQLQQLFPDSAIYREKFFGLNKSYIVIGNGFTETIVPMTISEGVSPTSR